MQTISEIATIIGYGCGGSFALILLWIAFVEIRDYVTGREPVWTDADIAMLNRQTARQIDEHMEAMK